MKVTISTESQTATGNKSKAIIFQWELSLEQLTELNDFANALVEAE